MRLGSVRFLAALEMTGLTRYFRNALLACILIRRHCLSGTELASQQEVKTGVENSGKTDETRI